MNTHLRLAVLRGLGSFAILAGSSLVAQTLYVPGGTVGNNTTDGNVGVGTAAPSNPQGWGRLLQVSNGSATTGAGLSIADQNGEWNLASYYGEFRPAKGGASPAILINSSGNVGIGTAAPAAKLPVVATDTGPAAFYTPRYYYVYLVGSDPTNGGAGIAFATKEGAGVQKTGYVLQDPTHGLKFLTDSTERMIVSVSGNVGIGTSSPGRRLDVTSDQGVSAGEKFIANFTQLAGQNGIFLGCRANGTGVSSALIRADNNLPIAFGTSAQNEAVHIANGGNVGIGPTSPSHKLSVNGTIKTKEVIVETTGWADPVFADNYRLGPLDARCG
ncbi:MAG TPA: hypothetical protein VEB66_12510 [Opitutaceae bacterium]|nr:hypothetical protein [Opitutaceae bacterium]